MLTPLEALREATKQVPAVRFAVGVIGVIAALAIATTFFHSVPAAVLAFLVMLVLMVLLYAFSILVVSGTGPFQIPVLILMYFCIFLFVTWSCLLTSCVFIEWPRTLPSLIGILIPTPKESVALETSKITNLETPKVADNAITLKNGRINFLDLPLSVRELYAGNEVLGSAARSKEPSKTCFR